MESFKGLKFKEKSPSLKKKAQEYLARDFLFVSLKVSWLLLGYMFHGHISAQDQVSDVASLSLGHPVAAF